MAQTYLFSKKSREEAYDNDTSYSFKLRRGQGWMQLNKKATTLIEYDDYYEVILADWYINVGDKFIAQSLTRQRYCQELQDYYNLLKKIKDDKERKNR